MWFRVRIRYWFWSNSNNINKQKKKGKWSQCRCGSTTHLSTLSKKCPLKKSNLNAKKESVKENPPFDPVVTDNGLPESKRV